MTNHPTKYKNYRTNDLSGVAFTKWSGTDELTGEQINRKTIYAHTLSYGGIITM